mmetsp:Transcript_16326/g.42075  ORF Transcript_16326/g.42075 Transcript_16326/m.42075 type:complete len:276 (+) Transcript_16326:297-1124(+)
MKVIGVGVPRTGTNSLQLALHALGYKCLHGFDLLDREDVMYKMHSRIVGGGAISWNETLTDFDACCDCPIYVMYDELQKEFPEAKYILTSRTEESWYRSLYSFSRLSSVIALASPFIPFLYDFNNLFLTCFHNYFHESRPMTKEKYLESYRKHNEKMKEIIPKEKLLIFDVREGWEPLCAFLEKPVPNIPFPHVNKGRATAEAKVAEKIKQVIPRPETLQRMACICGGVLFVILGTLLGQSSFILSKVVVPIYAMCAISWYFSTVRRIFTRIPSP